MESFSKVDPSKKWQSLDETNEDELSSNLCKFFRCLVKPDGTCYNSNSKKSYLAALKRHLIETRNIYLDRVGKYKEVYETVYSRMDESEIYEEDTGGCSPFREEDIKKCFYAGTMGLVSPKALLTLVIYNLVADFGCNSSMEVHDLLNSDFIYGPFNQSGEPEYVQLSDRVLNMRKEKRKRKSDKIGRIENDSGFLLGTSPVRTHLFYQKMKTSEQLDPDQPFLLNPVRIAQQQPTEGLDWFDNLRLGKNSIAKVFKTAFLEAGVDLNGQKIKLSSAKKTMQS